MTNSKTTKRALFSSVVALLLCFTMLLGTTFAWFTDSASSDTNKIVAGNLDVELYQADKAQPTDELVGSTTKLFDDVTLWEPGAMVWEKLTVKNNGSLALKYNLSVNVTDISSVGGKSLADVLTVAVLTEQPTRDNVASAATQTLATFNLKSDKALTTGNSDVVYVAIYWAPSANDNDYNVAGQALYANLGVTLLATQHTAESDSFDNQYDKDATYDGSVNPGTPNPPAGYAEAFADNSWEDIIEACQNNSVPATWNVGDKKTMTIGGTEYTIAIIGKNHDTYSDGSGNAPLTFQLYGVYNTTAVMNDTADNTTGWSGSKMRNTTMSEILAAMPSEVQNAIKAVDKLTLKGDKSGLETTSDKLFLLSMTEINGSTYWSGYEEGSRYDAFYIDPNSQVMIDSGSYYTRTPKNAGNSGKDTSFMIINGSGYPAESSAEYEHYVVFGFCF